ncbi:hypothetical protein DP939_07225 [Spongiactinospora rosea]|uniref:Uncharacterized protein n=1 Tax=Spongiactinospora rosea TaxID=2248750 RepID=A0A366M5W6_9ACTN|nr:hypothetical protein [Spongiactinospora rosea]RBQ20852.1 hypothetical protein DP939_07225 [Spongiactinospora rosea]
MSGYLPGWEQVEMSLPIAWERRFRPWKYSVSHSRLELRGFPAAVGERAIALAFHGVLAVRLRSVYMGLSLAEANAGARREMLSFAGVPPDADRVRCIVIGPDGRDGFVVCGTFSAWTAPGQSSGRPV